MRKLLCFIFAALCILLTACGNAETDKGDTDMYQQITQNEAKKIMDSGEDYIILDVREQDEFDEGHIPGCDPSPLYRN